MKLSRCKHCGAKASLFAKNCPECGKRIYHPVFGCVVGIVLLCAFFFSLLSQADAETKKEPVQKIQPASTEQTQKQDAEPETSNLVLGPGTYQVGIDIPSGKYDCIAHSGFGVLRGDVASAGPAGFVQTMGSSSASIGGVSAGVEAASSYSNLTLADGDTIYIEMSLNVEFVPK